MSNQTEKTNSGLNNLKAIHKIQSSGEIQELLRDLRASKNQLEDNLKNVFETKKKKSVASSTENNETVKKVVEEKPKGVAKPEFTEAKPVTMEEVLSFKDAIASMPDKQNQKKNEGRPAYSNDRRSFDKNNENKSRPQTNNNTNGGVRGDNQNSFANRQNNFNNQNRPFNNQNRNFGNNANGQSRPFNNQNGGYNNQNRPYNNQNGQSRPFNNQNGNFNGQNRPYNNQNGGYNNQNRPYNNQNGQSRPFNNQNGTQRPFENRNNNFVSSRANTFKKFEPTESARVLAQPERNMMGKTRNTRSYDEDRSQNRKLQQNRRLNGNMLNFDEERMGSRKLVKNKKKEQVTVVAAKIENATITTENVSVKVLSEKTGRPVVDIIKQLMLLGIMANINSTIDFATAELVAGELGVTLEQKLEKTYEQQMLDNIEDDKSDVNNVKRPPVVTVMGHVDHGKTSLLDVIRKTSVVSGEAGGITQKIGAYQIEWENNKITFIDTPGHSAFTSMRARGAKVTDIAILVVAADDGIMPQTVEAINHIKAAEVPMIVAINKIDKPDANMEKIKQQLAENNVLPEEWGGDAILVPVSAKNATNIDELLKTILLVAEVNEYKANPNTTATAVVIEAELDKNRGPIANILVENGTLKVGDSIMSGVSFGKVRAMFDENGKTLKSAGPSTPCAVLGLDSVPNSGDKMFAVNEKLSKNVIEERIAAAKNARSESTSGVSLEDFMDKVNEGKLKALNVIIKADVQGSVEALKQTLVTIRNEEARVNVIHSGAGPVTESDVILAKASGAIIINFNLKLAGKIEQIADSSSVQIKTYKIIYEVVDEITKAISGMLTVKYEEKVIGSAEVRQMFKLSSHGIICGSYIKDGKVTRNAFVNVYRGDEKILNTSIEALKIQKDDKAEVNYGYECGIKLKDSTGIIAGDILEVYQKVEIKRG